MSSEKENRLKLAKTFRDYHVDMANHYKARLERELEQAAKWEKTVQEIEAEKD